MIKVARWTIAHRRIVILGWVVATIGVFALSSAVGTKTANDFTLPGTGSQHAVDLLTRNFAVQAGDSDQIVFRARTGRLSDSGPRAAIGATLARVSHLPHVTGVISPYGPGAHAISASGTIGFVTVTFDERANALPKIAIDRVISAAEAARSSSLQVELGGQAIEQAQGISIGFATAVGVGAAVVILLISFGSFLAMGLPIVTALLGLGAGLGLIGLASQLMSMADFASQLALMIGLGVTILDGVAVAAAIGVVLVLGASLTLLPALLSLAGRRVGEVRARRSVRRAATKPGFWMRWVAQVQRRPALAAIAATL